MAGSGQHNKKKDSGFHPVKQIVEALAGPDFKNRLSGKEGELVANLILKFANIGTNRAVLHNLYVPAGSRTTEIDLAMLTERGIAVFEIKNYTGWIYGGAEQEQWVETFPNGEKYQFYSPIFQNRTHIRSLSRYLGLPERVFLSVIVFSNICVLKSVPSNTKSTMIVQRNDLRTALEPVLQKMPVIFSKQDIADMERKLKPLSRVSREEKKQHVKDVQEIKRARQTQGAPKKDAEAPKNQCPLCGKRLAVREGKYGRFWGCTGYPACKFTRNIS